MNSGKDDDGSEQVRYPRSRRWLQFYVDLFMTNCPQYCKDVSVTIVPDPERRNGCNWQLSVLTPEEKIEHESRCLAAIDCDLRLLFSVFDLAEGGDEDRPSSGLGLQCA